MKRIVVILWGIATLAGCDMPSRFEGQTQITYQGSVRAEGQYDNGVRSGQWVYYDAARNVIGKGTYQNGLMVEGLEITFANNGQKLMEGMWQNGNKEGHWVEYYRSGVKKTEGNYLNDKKTGVWREYDPSGYYAIEKVFEGGKLVGWRNFEQGRIGNPF